MANGLARGLYSLRLAGPKRDRFAIGADYAGNSWEGQNFEPVRESGHTTEHDTRQEWHLVSDAPGGFPGAFGAPRELPTGFKRD